MTVIVAVAPTGFLVVLDRRRRRGGVWGFDGFVWRVHRLVRMIDRYGWRCRIVGRLGNRCRVGRLRSVGRLRRVGCLRRMGRRQGDIRTRGCRGIRWRRRGRRGDGDRRWDRHGCRRLGRGLWRGSRSHLLRLWLWLRLSRQGLSRLRRRRPSSNGMDGTGLQPGGSARAHGRSSPGTHRCLDDRLGLRLSRLGGSWRADAWNPSPRRRRLRRRRLPLPTGRAGTSGSHRALGFRRERDHAWPNDRWILQRASPEVAGGGRRRDETRDADGRPGKPHAPAVSRRSRTVSLRRS